MKKLILALALIINLCDSLSANEFIEKLAKGVTYLKIGESLGAHLTEDGKKSISKILYSNPIISKKYYKSGNIKEKTQIYKNLISMKPKYSYKIITKYYDSEKATVAKSGFYIENEVVEEFINSDDGEVKCVTSPNELNEKVKSVIGKFVEGNEKSGFKFNENYIQNTIEKIGIERTSDFLTALPVMIFAKNEKTIECYSQFRFDFKVEMGDTIKLTYASGKKGSNVSTIEEANNIINKYYKVDLSVKDKLHNFKNDIVDFFK